MTEPEFMECFKGVYESSPWIVKRAYATLPFHNPAHLVAAFREIVNTAARDEQLALIKAHPDLGGKLARAGQLTPESTREQSRLGLDRLDPEKFQSFTRLNDQYRERFQIPFIICVGRLHDQAQVLEAFHSRMNNSPDQEHLQAMHQIHLIARLRLANLVEGLPPI